MTPTSDHDLKRKTVLNVSYNMTGKVAVMAVQLVSNIILSRVLAPADYGVVGFANIIVNFLWLFNDLGVNTSTIQRPVLEKSYLYTAFTIKLALGLLTACGAFLLAPLARFFIDNEEVVSVVRVLSVNFILTSLCFIPSVLMTRELEYKLFSIIGVFSAIVSSLVSVVLAYAGYRYWSLVIAILVMTMMNVILFNIVKPSKVRLGFDRLAVRSIVIFGGSVFISKVFTYFLFNTDNLAIGALKGSAALGYYALAFNWGAFISTIASAVVLSVLFPTFSRMQGDRERLRQNYLKVLEYVALFGAVAYVTLFVVARDFVIGVLGGGTDKWLPSLSCLHILCAYGFIRLLLEPIGSVCLALGAPGTMLKANVLATAVQMALLYPVVVLFDIRGVAVLVTIAYGLQYAVYIKETYKEIKVSAKEVFHRLLPSFALLPLSALALLDNFHEYTPYWLGIKIVLLLCACIVLHGLMTKWRLEREIVNILFHRKTLHTLEPVKD